jgi:Pentapeptide repeats (8 copies)
MSTRNVAKTRRWLIFISIIYSIILAAIRNIFTNFKINLIDEKIICIIKNLINTLKCQCLLSVIIIAYNTVKIACIRSKIFLAEYSIPRVLNQGEYKSRLYESWEVRLKMAKIQLDNQLDNQDRETHLGAIDDLSQIVKDFSQKCTEVDPESEQLDLSYMDMRGANLCEANLQGSNLYQTQLQGANLYRANLSRAILTAANLNGANLMGANLKQAILSAANLEAANLTEANLDGANLFLANLTGANLTGASLHQTNFREARVDGEWEVGSGE